MFQTKKMLLQNKAVKRVGILYQAIDFIGLKLLRRKRAYMELVPF